MSEGEESRRDDVGLWFRDRLLDAMPLGAAGFVVIAGWMLSDDSIVSLHHPTDADRREAAVLLLIFVPLMWATWYGYLVHLRKRCPEHPTVPARGWIHGVAWSVALALSVVLYAVVHD